MARSERSEGMSAGAWRVLEEDAVLLSWREVLHGCSVAGQESAVSQRLAGSVHARKENLARHLAARGTAKRRTNKNNTHA